MTTTSLSSHIIPGARVFGDPQLHIEGDLAALAFAADGTLWSVEEPGVIRSWNAATGKELSWQSPSDMETLWVLSPDTRRVASASDDLCLWDTSTGQLLTAIPQDSWVTALAFHADPNFVATGHDDGAIRFWDLAGQRLIREYRPFHNRPISALAFSPDGLRLASAAEDKTIGLWDAETGKLSGQFIGHTDRIPALAWHPKGDTLVSAGWDTTVRVWDANTCEPIILLNSHAMQVTALAFSRDGSLLATADSEDAVHLWDYATKKTLHVIRDQATDIRALAFSRDGKRLAFGGGDYLIHLCNPAQAQALSAGQPRTYASTTVSISPDGAWLASNGGGAAAQVWSINDRKPVFTLPEDQVVAALAFSPDGKRIAGGCREYIRVWDAITGQAGAALDGPMEPITTLAWSQDGATFASGSSQGTAVWLWRAADGEPTLIIPDALDGCTIETLAFHPKGRLLAVGGIDWLATGGSTGAISFWDLKDHCEVATFGAGTTCIAFDATGTRLAAASLDETVSLWDTRDQELLAELIGHDGKVNAVAWSPDGRLVATGSDDRTLRLWDAETAMEVAFRELDTQVKAIQFSHDGRYLFTGNGNTTCYQFETERLLQE